MNVNSITNALVIQSHLNEIIVQQTLIHEHDTMIVTKHEPGDCHIFSILPRTHLNY
jgi:hypothetical protein